MAIQTLAGIAQNGEQEASRVRAAEALLDRGWGKATQPVSGEDGGAIELIHRIERVIVNPSNQDG